MGSLEAFRYSAMRCMLGLFLLPILMAFLDGVGGYPSSSLVAAEAGAALGSSNGSMGDRALLRPMGFLPSNPFFAETDGDLRIIKQSMTMPLHPIATMSHEITSLAIVNAGKAVKHDIHFFTVDLGQSVSIMLDGVPPESAARMSPLNRLLTLQCGNAWYRPIATAADMDAILTAAQPVILPASDPLAQHGRSPQTLSSLVFHLAQRRPSFRGFDSTYTTANGRTVFALPRRVDVVMALPHATRGLSRECVWWVMKNNMYHVLYKDDVGTDTTSSSSTTSSTSSSTASSDVNSSTPSSTHPSIFASVIALKAELEAKTKAHANKEKTLLNVSPFTSTSTSTPTSSSARSAVLDAVLLHVAASTRTPPRTRTRRTSTDSRVVKHAHAATGAGMAAGEDAGMGVGARRAVMGDRANVPRAGVDGSVSVRSVGVRESGNVRGGAVFLETDSELSPTNSKDTATNTAIAVTTATAATTISTSAPATTTVTTVPATTSTTANVTNTNAAANVTSAAALQAMRERLRLRATPKSKDMREDVSAVATVFLETHAKVTAMLKTRTLAELMADSNAQFVLSSMIDPIIEMVPPILGEITMNVVLPEVVTKVREKLPEQLIEYMMPEDSTDKLRSILLNMPPATVTLPGNAVTHELPYDEMKKYTHEGNPAEGGEGGGESFLATETSIHAQAGVATTTSATVRTTATTSTQADAMAKLRALASVGVRADAKANTAANAGARMGTGVGEGEDEVEPIPYNIMAGTKSALASRMINAFLSETVENAANIMHNSLSHNIYKHTFRMLTYKLSRSMAVGLNQQLVPALANMINAIFSKSLTTQPAKQLNKLLTRSLTSSVALTVTKALTRAPAADVFCELCRSGEEKYAQEEAHIKDFCAACFSAESESQYIDYYTAYYADYYGRYYDWYYSDHYVNEFALDHIYKRTH